MFLMIHYLQSLSSMTLNILSLAAGLFILIKSADYLVDGASSIAKRYRVPPIVIGLTIVAFGTSAPELVVNLLSAFRGAPALAVGNIMGSNIANLMLILGIAACIRPLRVKLTTVTREVPFMLLAALMVLVMSLDVVLDGASANILSRTNGIALLGFFAIFLFYTFLTARAGMEENKDDIKTHKPWIAGVMVMGGLLGLALGGNFLVEGAISIARLLGVSEGLIGLTIVAVGTSLPELVTSIAAVRKGMVDLAVGNVVGSNIFNIFFVLGTTATILPLPFSRANLVDASAFVAISLLFFASLVVDSKKTVTRWKGGVLVAFYVAYIAYTVFIYT